MRKIGKMANPQLREHQLNVLVGILSKAKTSAEIRSIMKTVFTKSEREAIAQRVTILNRIKKGEKYYEIEGEFGASPSTISKALDIYLKNGEDNRNFNKVLSRYKEPEFKYKVNAKFPTKKASREIFGIRSLQKEQAKTNKLIMKHKSEQE